MNHWCNKHKDIEINFTKGIIITDIPNNTHYTRGMGLSIQQPPTKYVQLNKNTSVSNDLKGKLGTFHAPFRWWKPPIPPLKAAKIQEWDTPRHRHLTYLLTLRSVNQQLWCMLVAEIALTWANGGKWSGWQSEIYVCLAMMGAKCTW